MLFDDRLLGLREHQKPGSDLRSGCDLAGQMRVQEELLARILDLLRAPFPTRSLDVRSVSLSRLESSSASMVQEAGALEKPGKPTSRTSS